MNKVLVNVYVPMLEEYYDIWIPLNKRIYKIIFLIYKGINEIEDNIYKPKKLPILYNKETGKNYDLKEIVKDTDIVNGTELIMI